MTKKDWFGIAYVSTWVIIWGTVGSLIDLPFLNAGIYLPASVGQITTFFLTALACIIVSILIFPKASNLLIKSSKD